MGSRGVSPQPPRGPCSLLLTRGLQGRRGSLVPAVTWAHPFLPSQGALRVRCGSDCSTALSPDPTPGGLVERDRAEKQDPVLLATLPRGQQDLFRCKVPVHCCFPGKSQKPVSTLVLLWPAGSVPRRGQAHFPQGEPRSPTYCCSFDLLVPVVKSKLT